MSRRTLPRLPVAAALFAGLLALAAPAAAAPLPEDPRLLKARDLEQSGKWLDACRAYDELAHFDRGRDEYRSGYRRCLRRYHLAERHRDPAYHKAVDRLTAGEALDVYQDVLAKVDKYYVDHDRADVAALFRQGVEELSFALGEEPFRRAYFPDARPEAVRTFAGRLSEWQARPVASRGEARRQVLEVARAAEESGLAPRRADLARAFALEFACGCCNALDEYTRFLAPGHYGAFQAALEGKVAGVGLEVAALADGQLAVTRVYARTPAEESGLEPNVYLLRVDRRPVGQMPAEAVAELLRGEPGSVVEVEVRAPGATSGRGVKLTRRTLPSVRYAELRDPYGPPPGAGGVWLLGVSHFQRSTAKEVQEALIEMGRVDQGRPGLGGLVLDLRGNPGGLLDPAVQVAEVFLGEAVVAYSSGPWPKYNRPWEARGLHPQPVPLAVLIDGDTASAAEVLAGALKEHGRARLYGQTTYGKGSVQVTFPMERPPLDKTPGGLRITVARLYSPSKQPYAGRGVAPDVAVPADGDEAVEAAAHDLRGVVKARMGLMPPG